MAKVMFHFGLMPWKTSLYAKTLGCFIDECLHGADILIGNIIRDGSSLVLCLKVALSMLIRVKCAPESGARCSPRSDMPAIPTNFEWRL